LAATLLASVLITGLGPYRYRAGEPEENHQIVHIQAEDRPCAI